MSRKKSRFVWIQGNRLVKALGKRVVLDTYVKQLTPPSEGTRPSLRVTVVKNSGNVEENQRKLNAAKT